ncbi:MAG: helix-turn-helix transcriptional regulator [Syntrophomonas sp.]
MLNKEKFANRLKSLRQSKGISTRSLAAAIGLKSHGAIAQFEKGTSLPALDTLVKMADYFDVTLDYLVGVTDTPHSIYKNEANNSYSEFPSKLTELPGSTEATDKMAEPKLKDKTEELIVGLDEESMTELHKFLRYLHARQTLDREDEKSCGLDIKEVANPQKAKSS